MKINDPASLLRYITAMAIFGSIGIARRYIPMESAPLACFRGAAGCLFLLLMNVLRKENLQKLLGRRDQAGVALPKEKSAILSKLSGKALLLLVFSGTLIGLNWIFLFESYKYTKVSTATLCYYMQPTLVILMSPILFREKLTWKQGICALVSLAGMVLVSGILKTDADAASERLGDYLRAWMTSGDMKGIFFGLTAALLYAIIVILNKKLPGIEANRKTILQLGSAAIVLLPYVLLTGQSFRMDLSAFGASRAALAVGLLFVVGIVHTGFAYRLYFGSMDGLRAQTLAVLAYLDPVIAVILSALILGETMQLPEIIGAVMILGAALVGELHND